MLQIRLCTESPKQRLHPFDGTGLLQLRDLVEILPPQLTVHLFQFDQELQSSFTKKHINKIFAKGDINLCMESLL